MLQTVNSSVNINSLQLNQQNSIQNKSCQIKSNENLWHDNVVRFIFHRLGKLFKSGYIIDTCFAYRRHVATFNLLIRKKQQLN